MYVTQNKWVLPLEFIKEKIYICFLNQESLKIKRSNKNYYFYLDICISD